MSESRRLAARWLLTVAAKFTANATYHCMLAGTRGIAQSSLSCTHRYPHPYICVQPLLPPLPDRALTRGTVLCAMRASQLQHTAMNCWRLRFHVVCTCALLVIAAATSATPSFGSADLRELDATSLFAVIGDDQQDHLVLFAKAEHGDAARLIEGAAEALHTTSSSSLSLSLYRVDLHGMPAGVHLHSLPAIVLFPAGAREPVLFEGRHPSGHSHAHGHGHHGAADHDHSTCSGHHDHVDDDEPTTYAHDEVATLLQWAHESATFSAEIPAQPDAQWVGREDGVVRAIADGLGVLQRRLAQLAAENAELRAALSKCERRNHDK